MKNLLIQALFFAFLPLSALRGQTTTLHIQLTDSLSREPLIGAAVRLETGGGLSDATGNVSIPDLAPGAHRLICTCLGYQPKTLTIQLPADTLRIALAPTADQLEEVIVQSTRSNSRVEDSPTKVEVLGRDDMDEENGIRPGNVASILGDYSGIQIQSTGLASGNAQVRILGLPGRYTQVLRDGLPVYGGLAGDFGILQVQPLDLQQIELIKGPASTLFGGGAIAGIVNFISKTPGAKAERSLTLNQTTLGETNLNLWLAGRQQHWGGTFFAGGTRQNARDVDGDGFTDLPRLRSLTLHPRGFYYPTPNDRLALGLTFVGESRLGGDLSAVQDGATTNHPYREDNQTQRLVGDFAWRHTAGKNAEWNAKGAFGVFNRRQDLPGWRFDGEQQDWFSELSYRHSQGNWNWVGGLNYSGNAFDKGRTDSLLFDNFQNSTLGAFVQAAVHRAGKFDAEAGLRLDRHNRFGAFLLPSAALLYHLTPSFSARAGAGLGYATANPLTSLGHEAPELRRVLAPPAGLKAERSFGGSLEWNFRHIFGEQLGVFLNQQFFYTLVQQPFLTLPDGAGHLAWSNADQPATTHGVDNYIRLSYQNMELYLGYTYALARQEWDAMQPYVPLTPRHRAAGVFALPLGEHWRSGIEASWSGPQIRDDGTRTQDFLFMAGMVGFHWKHLDLVLNGENLLDFRQTSHERVVLPPLANPRFVPLWAPVDGRVINLSASLRL